MYFCLHGYSCNEMVNTFNWECSTTLSQACDGGMPTFPHYGFSEDSTLYDICPSECPEVIGFSLSHINSQLQSTFTNFKFKEVK